MLAKGYALRPGQYGVRWSAQQRRWAPMRYAKKCMCPLGALVVVEQPGAGAHRSTVAAACDLLGVDVEWVIDFQVTWDQICPGLASPGADAAREMLTWLEQRSREEPEDSPGEPSASEAKAEAG